MHSPAGCFQGRLGSPGWETGGSQVIWQTSSVAIGVKTKSHFYMVKRTLCMNLN